MRMSRAVRTTVNALVQDPLRGATAVVLECAMDKAVMPIWIGLPEALAISHALTGKQIERPLTHMLLLNSILSLNGSLRRVEITRIEQSTFFAVLHVSVGRKMVMIDARPSDAIALALNANVPILVAERVWKSSCIPLDTFGLITRPKRQRSFNELQKKLKSLRSEESHMAS